MRREDKTDNGKERKKENVKPASMREVQNEWLACVLRRILSLKKNKKS